MTDEITPQERNEVRALLASALTPEPPMRLRATEVLERARRRSLWRRLVTGFGALVLAGGVGTGTVVAVSAGAGGPSADPSPDTTTSRPLMPLPPPETLPPMPTQRVDEGSPATLQHAVELTALLEKAHAAGRLLPEGMRLSAERDGNPPLQVRPSGLDGSPGWSYQAEAGVEGVHGRGRLFVAVYAPRTDTVRACPDPASFEGNWHRTPPLSCQVVQMPNGQPAQATLYDRGGGLLMLELTALTANGMLLKIGVTNEDFTVPPPSAPSSPGSEYRPPTAQPDLPLNRDDLIRIATLPGLGY